MKRYCACPRKEPMDGMRANAVYASAACRTRDWKRRKGIVGIRYVKASQNAKPSGIQLAYRRTYHVLVDHFISRGEPYPEILARKILAVGLSDRQRALLEERQSSERQAA